MKSKKDSANVGVIVKHRAPDESSQSEDQDDPDAAMEACGQAIIDAVQSGNAKAVADACQDMFQMCENQPHSEGVYTYDAQNEKAAKDND